MSSSERFPDWNLFAEREVRLDVRDFLSPALEVGAMLQHHKDALAKTRQEVEDVRHAYLQALAQQAILVYKFEARLLEVKQRLQESSVPQVYRALRILKDQMLDGLRAAEIKIESPLGRPYNQVVEVVEVLGWQHRQEFQEESVIEVLEPIIWYQTMPIHLGLVTIGAPLSKEQN